MDFRFGLIVLLCLVGLANGRSAKFINCGKLHKQDNSLTWFGVVDGVEAHFDESFSYAVFVETIS